VSDVIVGKEGKNAMTEQEWLDCPGPCFMLEFLENRTTARKLRLFGYACCRRLWHLLSDRRSRDAVEVAERYVDGLASRREMDDAYGPAGTFSGADTVSGRDEHQLFSLEKASPQMACCAGWIVT
jgi:hypothetical protein